MKIVVPVIMSISLMMILGITTYSGYGQMATNTATTANITDTVAATADSNNQINQNSSQPAQEKINLAEQQIPV